MKLFSLSNVSVVSILLFILCLILAFVFKTIDVTVYEGCCTASVAFYILICICFGIFMWKQSANDNKFSIPGLLGAYILSIGILSGIVGLILGWIGLDYVAEFIIDIGWICGAILLGWFFLYAAYIFITKAMFGK